MGAGGWRFWKRGYLESTQSMWDYALSRSITESFLSHDKNGNWTPLVEVELKTTDALEQLNLAPPVAKSKKHEPKPVAVKAGTKAGAKPRAKQKKAKPSRTEKSWSKGPNVVRGLLGGYDRMAPFDMMLQPQYEVTVSTKTPLRWRPMDPTIGSHVVSLNVGPLPENPSPLIREILDGGGSQRALVHEPVPNYQRMPDEYSPKKASRVNVTGATWIKGSQITSVSVLGSYPAYFFRFEGSEWPTINPWKEKGIVSPDGSHDESIKWIASN